MVGGGVPGVLAELGAADLAVDEPGDGVGRPADLVLVVVVEGVGEGDVASFFVWWGLGSAWMWRDVWGKTGGYGGICERDLQFVIP